LCVLTVLRKEELSTSTDEITMASNFSAASTKNKFNGTGLECKLSYGSKQNYPVTTIPWELAK